MGHTSLSTTVISPQLCRISIIAACSRNRVIGRDGRLPWDIPEDWGYFLDQTSSGTLLLGRRCYEEMRERHLKNPRVIVLSRDPNFYPAFGHRACSLNEGLSMAREFGKEIWICGGENVYTESLEIADRLLLTLIDEDIDGDTFFPYWHKHFPEESSCRPGCDENYHYAFHVFERGNLSLN